VDLLYSDDELFQELCPAVLRATEKKAVENAELLVRLVLELMMMNYTHVRRSPCLKCPNY
jgi:hypothetical protein